MNGDMELVKLLLNKKADPNVTTKEGHTPLHLARDGNHTKLVELLVRYYTTNNSKNRSNNTTTIHSYYPLQPSSRGSNTNPSESPYKLNNPKQQYDGKNNSN